MLSHDTGSININQPPRPGDKVCLMKYICCSGPPLLEKRRGNFNYGVSSPPFGGLGGCMGELEVSSNYIQNLLYINFFQRIIA
jgi:hypothetical protein